MERCHKATKVPICQKEKEGESILRERGVIVAIPEEKHEKEKIKMRSKLENLLVYRGGGEKRVADFNAEFHPSEVKARTGKSGPPPLDPGSRRGTEIQPSDTTCRI